MKAPQDIILAPVVTERSMAGFADKKYTFRVANDATKVDIARAVEQKFGVQVAKVNTVNVRGHVRRMGRYEGMTAAWKKAVVTLDKDSKTIDFFDGLL